jgi:hypothetical protein
VCQLSSDVLVLGLPSRVLCHSILLKNNDVLGVGQQNKGVKRHKQQEEMRRINGEEVVLASSSNICHFNFFISILISHLIKRN